MSGSNRKVLRAIACLLVTVTILLARVACEAPADDASAKKLATRVEGARIRYTPRPVARRRRTPEGELALIERAQGSLDLEVPVRYRDAAAGPGRYSVRVETAEDGKCYLLLESRSTKVPPRRSRLSPEQNEKGKHKNKDNDERAEPRRDGDGGRASAPREEAVAARPSTHLRAALALSTAGETSDSVRFSLSLLRDGTRLRVRIQAGTTVGQAVLRVDTEGGEKEIDPANRDSSRRR